MYEIRLKPLTPLPITVNAIYNLTRTCEAGRHGLDAQQHWEDIAVAMPTKHRSCDIHDNLYSSNRQQTPAPRVLAHFQVGNIALEACLQVSLCK